MTDYQPGFNPEDGSCPCGGHAVQRMNAKTKQVFHGCSEFPKCRNVQGPRRTHGDFFLSADDYDEAFYEAFYEGDGR